MDLHGQANLRTGGIRNTFHLMLWDLNDGRGKGFGNGLEMPLNTGME